MRLGRRGELWYMARAIALPQVPEHFHSCSHAAIARWRNPSNGLLGRQDRRSIRRIATLHIGSRNASLREWMR
jgi:tRNA G37 N-methylase TrmD